MQAFLISTGTVALGEIGDKTQLLALLLAARYHQPLPIIAGILVATLANHAAAAALGGWTITLVDPDWARWIAGLSFVAVAVWMLVPDTSEESEDRERRGLGVFGVTVVAFFLTEMGDKTQVATIVLAAQFQSLVAVTAGTTLGMMLANVPIVLLGERAMRRVPLAWVRRVAALVFAIVGVLVVAGVGL
jgi:putative Ca2+/H+ antiporter (TMEM165/GDT1 family)